MKCRPVKSPSGGGDSIATLLFQIASDAPTPASDYRPDLPGDVLAVIDRCLKKNPDERYQRGSEMAADLRKSLAHLRAGGSPPPRVMAPTPAAAQAAASSISFDKTVVNEAPKPAESERTLIVEPGDKE